MQYADAQNHGSPVDALGWDPALFGAYVKLAAGLLDQLAGICLLDGHGRALGTHGGVDLPVVRRWIDELRWNGAGVRQPAAKAAVPGEWFTCMPIETEDTLLLGVLCVRQSLPILPTHPAHHAATVAARLAPLLDCIRRGLVTGKRLPERVRASPERTAELEWLFTVLSHAQGAGDERTAIQALLAAGALRLDSVLAVCEIFDQRLCVEHVCRPAAGEPGIVHPALRGLWIQTRRNFLAGVPARGGLDIPHCKILAAPVIGETGRILGLMGFLNPPDRADFGRRQFALAQHLARQVAVSTRRPDGRSR